MPTIKACIFDLDGVIVDTAKYHYLAWRRLAHELGFQFSQEQNESLKGVSRMQSLDILLEIGNIHVDEATKTALAIKKNEWYCEYITKMTPDEILPGAKEFLKEIKKAKIKTAIGSASKNAMTILQHINMAHDFDIIIDGTKTTKAKPDPEVFLKAAAELGIEPNLCVVFEDATAGVQAAIKGGMYCIGVGSAKILHEADFVIASLKEMNIERLNF
jgi:beta-phosphoglucomutase